MPVACNETVALFANGEAENPMRLLTLTQQYIAPMPDPEPTPAPTSDPTPELTTELQNSTSDPVSSNLCKWDNVDHGTSFFGRLIAFFHSVLYTITHIFKR